MSTSNDSVTLRRLAVRAHSSVEQPIVLVAGSEAGCEPCSPGRLVGFSGTLVVGRRAAGDSAESSLVLPDPTISSRHMIIGATRSGEFELRDLGSTNGTLVDGELVKAPVKLHDGAVIFAGGHVMVFRTASLTQIEAINQELASPLGPVATVNPSFAVVCQRMRLLARTNEDVLLSGERGVGKAIYARAIHQASGRKGEIVTIDCAAMSPERIEAELFGDQNAPLSRRSPGKPTLIEQAESGTLFLDEVDELPPGVLLLLLRLTGHDLIPPVGRAHSRFNVRIIAATSRTTYPGESGLARPDAAVRFGSDPIVIPPLRERVEDIGALAHHLLGDRNRAFELAAFQALCLHPWPGNVRELRKTIASAEAFSQHCDRIRIEHLPSAVLGTPRIRPTARRKPRPPPAIEDLETLLRRHRGNILRVSRELDRKPAVVYRWARRFGLAVKAFRPVRG